MIAKLAELGENLKLVEHKVAVYRGRLSTGDTDGLWAPTAQQMSAEQSAVDTPNAPDHSQVGRANVLNKPV